MASSHIIHNSVNILHNHNMSLGLPQEMVLEEQAPTSFPNSSSNILILHLPMDMHICQIQLYIILIMVQICHHNTHMVCHSTCSKALKCKVLLKEFHNKAAHSIQVTAHHLSNILIHSKFSNYTLRSNEGRPCHQLFLNKNDHNRDLHHSHNSNKPLNSSHLSKSKRSSNLHLSKCLSL